MSGSAHRGAGPSGSPGRLATAFGDVGDQTPRPLRQSPRLGDLWRSTVHPAGLSRRDRLLWTLGVAGVVGLLVLLDSSCSPFALDPGVAVRPAAVFGGIVGVLSVLADWIATAAEVTAAYVWIALQWLGSVTAALLRSTGAMFSKVWDATRIVWSDVLKPALVWLDDNLKRLGQWLKDTLKPVTDFLEDLRTRVRAFYDMFVKPVVDTIDFIRAINRTLMVFHIDLLSSLDKTLQQLEARLNEPFDFIERKLTEVSNWINKIVTLDGLLQRITLIKSMSRYAPAWVSGFWNTQIDGDELAARTAAIPTDVPVDLPSTPGEQLAAFYSGDGGDYADVIASLMPFWREAAGVDPPGTAEA